MSLQGPEHAILTVNFTVVAIVIVDASFTRWLDGTLNNDLSIVRYTCGPYEP